MEEKSGGQSFQNQTTWCDLHSIRHSNVVFENKNDMKPYNTGSSIKAFQMIKLVSYSFKKGNSHKRYELICFHFIFFWCVSFARIFADGGRFDFRFLCWFFNIFAGFLRITRNFRFFYARFRFWNKLELLTICNFSKKRKDKIISS